VSRGQPGPSAATVAAELARASHLMPTLAVTAFGTTLAAAAGKPLATCVLVALSVLCGQLSIGWSNDRIDTVRDVEAGRHDKPIATGRLSVRIVDTAIALAVVGVVTLSLLLGWRAALVHLGAVAVAWCYNLGIKATWWSWLPYAIAFGALPAVATYANPDPRAPAAWVVAGAAMLGVAGHLANVLPDAADDVRAGVRGLPHRIGERSTVLVGAGLLIGATILVSWNGLDSTGARWVALLAVCGLVIAGTAWSLRRPVGPVPFLGTVLITAVNLVLIVAGGSSLR
jgi:4-hydroxybenzoate polyprenyltransferase